MGKEKQTKSIKSLDCLHVQICLWTECGTFKYKWSAITQRRFHCFVHANAAFVCVRAKETGRHAMLDDDIVVLYICRARMQLWHCNRGTYFHPSSFSAASYMVAMPQKLSHATAVCTSCLHRSASFFERQNLINNVSKCSRASTHLTCSYHTTRSFTHVISMFKAIVPGCEHTYVHDDTI